MRAGELVILRERLIRRIASWSEDDAFYDRCNPLLFEHFSSLVLAHRAICDELNVMHQEEKQMPVRAALYIVIGHINRYCLKNDGDLDRNLGLIDSLTQLADAIESH